MAAPPTYHERTHRLGTLCFGGDWACAHGDISGLRRVAQQLAAVLRKPLHDELLELAEACHRDPDRAARMWCLVKPRLLDRRRPAPGPSPVGRQTRHPAATR